MLIFNELKKQSSVYYPAILLSHFCSHDVRKWWRVVSLVLLLASLAIMVTVPFLNYELTQSLIPSGVVDFFLGNIFRIRGLFFVLFVIWFKSYLIEFFYLSHYFKKNHIDYEVAKLAYEANSKDITGSFLKSKIGQDTMKKLGISEDRVENFLNDPERYSVRDYELRFSFNARKSPLDDRKVVNLPDYMKAVLDRDSDFRNLIFKNNLTEDEFFGAVEWVQEIAWKTRQRQRFWNKENLVRISTIGRNWYFENVRNLDKCTHLIYENIIYRSLGKHWQIFRDEAEVLEAFLLDQKLNNVILVSDKVVTGMQVVSAFGKMIIEGYCLPQFENKKMLVVNHSNLIVNNNPEETQKNFLQMINQVSLNRDLILVFPNIAELEEKMLENNVDIIKILKKILNTKSVPVIAVASKADYFSIVETDYELARHFDKHRVPNIDKDFILRILKDEAEKIEKHDGVIITYPVLSKISEKYSIDKQPIRNSLVELHRLFE